MASVANLSATPGPAAAGSLTLRQRCEKIARRTWRGIREWCGDAAYEAYLRSKSRRHSAGRPLTAKEFYVEQLERRYSRPNRCC
jgi:uncharacterized short protein YbdD (DUF466 family)